MTMNSSYVRAFVGVRHSAIRLFITLLLLLPALSLHAAILTVDCSKKSLQGEISARLDKTAINTVNFSGNCVGPVVLTGHVNLTLIGTAANATIAGVAGGALKVEGGTVAMQNFTVNGNLSSSGVECTSRSVCVLRNVNVLMGGVAGAIGIGAQDQSAIDIIGTVSVSGGNVGSSTGVGAFGASSINIRPTWALGFDPTEPGATISGHESGVFVQDGSFLRSDNAFIQQNEFGVTAQRNATIKILGNQIGGVTGNTNDGVVVWRGSTAQVGTTISGNGFGVYAGTLSYIQILSGTVITSNGGGNFGCDGPTAIIEGGGYSCISP